jgi:hypothetical protein
MQWANVVVIDAPQRRFLIGGRATRHQARTSAQPDIGLLPGMQIILVDAGSVSWCHAPDAAPIDGHGS